MTTGTDYDRFCDLLWAYARYKGLGATESDLKDTPFPYADMKLGLERGYVTIDAVLDRFALAAHRHRRRGRRISEAE